MSTAARKARKRAYRKYALMGEIADPGQFQFVHPVKVGTPLVERLWFTEKLRGAVGTRNAQKWVPRSLVKRNRALKARGLAEVQK